MAIYMIDRKGSEKHKGIFTNNRRKIRQACKNFLEANFADATIHFQRNRTQLSQVCQHASGSLLLSHYVVAFVVHNSMNLTIYSFYYFLLKERTFALP